ncbi:MAG: heat-shock protein Hsp20 [Proteobacteria bacterium]|nr:heat-shock protein Hsp20 [Pseudomonadota bacterium]
MNTAMRWEPFRNFDEFFNNFSPLFGRLPYTPALASNEPDLGWMPVTDILEGDKEFIVKLDLPEVPREAVEVLADDDTLVIKGERKLVRDKGFEVLRSEIGYGPFERRFMLPDIVDRKLIRADFRDGVLLVHLPKMEQKVVEPRKIAIS